MRTGLAAPLLAASSSSSSAAGMTRIRPELRGGVGGSRRPRHWPAKADPPVAEPHGAAGRTHHHPRPPLIRSVLPSAQPAEPLGAAVCTHRLPCPLLPSSPLPEPKAAKRPKPEKKEKEAAPAPAVWPAGRELDTSPSGRGVLLSARKNEREDNGEY